MYYYCAGMTGPFDVMTKATFSLIFTTLSIFTLFCGLAAGQDGKEEKGKQKVRTMSIPISIFTKEELRDDQLSEFVMIDRLMVKEDKDDQTILSIRSLNEAPLSLAILVQEDLSSAFNLQLTDLAAFIRGLPRGSRVMVAYLRGGSMQVRHKFTDDLDAAARSLRIVSSNPSSAPRNPYDGLLDALDRFDSLPAGRRAVLMFSDGLDISHGVMDSTPAMSLELDRAALQAQRRSVAVYSIYSPASLTEAGDTRLILNGQGSLQKIADETGGRAFFQGSLAPITYLPIFRNLNKLLNRQFLLTYMSTHMEKGYHRVDVKSTNPDVKIEHPRGYYYRQ